MAGLLWATGVCPAQNMRALDSAQHLRTKSFDIYYPSGLEGQARRLAGFADTMFEELTAFFGAAPHGAGKGGDRIPVLLSDRSPYLNGYSIPYPSNRIVLYLAQDGMTNELASLDDELYYVFLHELTHTITLNMRSPLMAALSGILGDYLCPSLWMMPDAVLEGTAVWVESNAGAVSPASLRLASLKRASLNLAGDTTDVAGTATEPSGAGTADEAGATGGAGQTLRGRLHDPAALEPVFSDLSQGGAASIWAVSGLDDYPGSGGMAYYYGALLSQFLTERYGAGALAHLWSSASGGNIAQGYDGTLTSGGIVEALTGSPEKVVWDEFMAWVGEQSSAVHGRRDPTVVAAGTRVGAFTAGNDAIFYVDHERNAVCCLSLATALAADMAERKPVRLFAADGLIERLSLSEDGKQLLVDWVRRGPGGETIPARYGFDLGSRRLRLLEDRSQSRRWLPSAPATELSGWTYGLLRQGARIVPARRGADGNCQALEGAPEIVRSISAERLTAGNGRGDPEGSESTRLALAFTQKGGRSQVAIAEGVGAAGAEGEWTFFLQKRPPEGGIHDPVFAAGDILLYRTHLPGGKSTLCWMRVDRQALEEDFVRTNLRWVPVPGEAGELADNAADKGADTRAEEVACNRADAAADKAAGNGPGMPDAATGGSFQGGGQKCKPALFPALGSTARYPYINGGAAGIQVEGADLTERAAWTAATGWNYRYSAPELTFSAALIVDKNSTTISLYDGPALGSSAPSVERISGAAIDSKTTWIMLPAWRRCWLDIQATIAGVGEQYGASQFFCPDYDYANVGSRAGVGYSTIRESPFAPFDKKGFAARAAADYEVVPGRASGWGVSAGMDIALPEPALCLSADGSLALDQGLAFRPAGRILQGAGETYASVLAPTWPEYYEYEALTATSPWYLRGEVQARVFSIEASPALKNIRLPFLPSLAIRRSSLFCGVRAALLEVTGRTEAPASVFARLETDGTFLAGMASMLHIEPAVEFSFIFRPDLAKADYKINLGLEVSY